MVHPRVQDDVEVGDVARAIPAGAGRTLGPSTADSGSAGHPPVCGENSIPRSTPPRALRAIPACAGRTPGRPGCLAPLAGPYPRVRGELQALQKVVGNIAGHPRVCGENCLLRDARGSGGRAIPACAGRTSAGSMLLALSAGHPRVCGENGTLMQRQLGGLRAIPACAGRTHTSGPSFTHSRRAIPACAGRT